MLRSSLNGYSWPAVQLGRAHRMVKLPRGSRRALHPSVEFARTRMYGDALKPLVRSRIIVIFRWTCRFPPVIHG
jgi:hypothetical protein